MIALNLQAHTGNVDEDLVSYITAWGFARLPAAHKFDRPAVKVVMQRQETQNAQLSICHLTLETEEQEEQKEGNSNAHAFPSNAVMINDSIFQNSNIYIGCAIVENVDRNKGGVS
eukprot:TRINITY_DN5287_c0_g2_i2.p1 TRINITY_DN5287_c0_g2~~TRINITY_DN5287_c0_g2_i2.p1  ORF type:complete len:115 (-),score=21.83 TRINITY_DN5287_c0_g2_i2:80-424(-)